MSWNRSNSKNFKNKTQINTVTNLKYLKLLKINTSTIQRLVNISYVYFCYRNIKIKIMGSNNHSPLNAVIKHIYIVFGYFSYSSKGQQIIYSINVLKIRLKTIFR
uniref:Uncharacterized protein n=1 Tax=Sipha flava TaxID=143950 RepID=A0A2S2PXL2_9HEMI